MLHGKLYHLPVKERQLIKPVLLKYAHLFHDEQMNDFKGPSVIEHEIPLNDTRPIRKPQYRDLYALREEMQTQVENMLDRRNPGKPIPLVSPCNIGPQKDPRREAEI